MLALIGFVLMAVLMVVLIKSWVSPPVAFISLPLIAAVIAGFGVEEIGGFIGSGMKSMLSTAVLFVFSISYFTLMDEIGLFDKVTIYIEEDDEEQTIELVTTLRQNALKGLISKESPVGKAVLGHKVGDRVTVQVNENYSYDIVIRAVEKGQDDASLPISSY